MIFLYDPWRTHCRKMGNFFLCIVKLIYFHCNLKIGFPQILKENIETILVVFKSLISKFCWKEQWQNSLKQSLINSLDMNLFMRQKISCHILQKVRNKLFIVDSSSTFQKFQTNFWIFNNVRKGLDKNVYE